MVIKVLSVIRVNIGILPDNLTTQMSNNYALLLSRKRVKYDSMRKD